MSWILENNMKKIIKKIKINNTNRGFTILETLVAIFILVLAITGPMVFAQSSLRTAFLSRDQITAFFLAQDAIETIKNIRDDNAIKQNDWLDGIYKCNDVLNDGECTVSVETLYYPEQVNDGEQHEYGEPYIAVCGETCPELRHDTTGRFGYSIPITDSSSSRFTRTISLREAVANAELEIVVKVEWRSNVRTDKSRIVVQENIFNWIPQGGQNQ